MGRGFSAASGKLSSCLQGLTCAAASPAEFSRSLVRREAFDRTVGSGVAVLGARETAGRGH